MATMPRSTTRILSALIIERECMSASATSCTSKPRSTSRSRSFCERRRSEEHTSELQSRLHLVCRLLLEKKKTNMTVDKSEHPYEETCGSCDEVSSQAQ